MKDWGSIWKINRPPVAPLLGLSFSILPLLASHKPVKVFWNARSTATRTKLKTTGDHSPSSGLLNRITFSRLGLWDNPFNRTRWKQIQKDYFLIATSQPNTACARWKNKNEPYHMYIIINIKIKKLSDKHSCLFTHAHAQRLQYQGRHCAAYATRPIFTFSSLRTQYLVHHRMGTYGTCLPREFAFVRSEIKSLLAQNMTITLVDLSVAFLTVNWADISSEPVVIVVHEEKNSTKSQLFTN